MKFNLMPVSVLLPVVLLGFTLLHHAMGVRPKKQISSSRSLIDQVMSVLKVGDTMTFPADSYISPELSGKIQVGFYKDAEVDCWDITAKEQGPRNETGYARQFAFELGGVRVWEMIYFGDLNFEKAIGTWDWINNVYGKQRIINGNLEVEITVPFLQIQFEKSTEGASEWTTWVSVPQLAATHVNVVSWQPLKPHGIGSSDYPQLDLKGVVDARIPGIGNVQEFILAHVWPIVSDKIGKKVPPKILKYERLMNYFTKPGGRVAGWLKAMGGDLGFGEGCSLDVQQARKLELEQKDKELDWSDLVG